MSSTRTPSRATVEFLRWVGAASRTYADTMEAWQTSCPRFALWEDSLADGLICLEPRETLAASIVALTASGRDALGAWK